MRDLDEEYSAEEWTNIQKEFQRLAGQHYLDHAGAGLYSEEQLNAIAEDLKSSLYANPHTSKVTEDLIDQVRYRVLKFFNSDDSEYDLVFNRGATEGLKTIAECFEFGANGKFMYSPRCHTSVLGMREIVRTNHVIPVETGDDAKDQSNRCGSGSKSLFVLPAQCNFNGHKYDLGITSSSEVKDKLFVCLDAAAFVSTSYLDLTKHRPDFVCLSFYKIFGYPTGLGALLIRKSSGHVLQKKYYGGGTVEIAMSGTRFHKKRNSLREQFEDGTISFLSIISLLHGFDTLERLVPAHDTLLPIQRISMHTFRLAQYLFETLSALTYSNGKSVVKIYAQTDYTNPLTQGATVAFNILHSDGNFVGFSEFNCMAEIHNITLRVGCFCNPGACQQSLQLSDDQVLSHFKAGRICGDSNDLIDNIPTGCVRVSLGYMTAKANVDALIDMIKLCYLSRVELVPEVNCNDTPERIKLQQICVYPVKSCAAFKVFSKWPLTRRGLKYDREWMIVSANGVAVTQKTCTRMCLIRPVIDERRNVLRLTFPERDPIEVPLKRKDPIDDSQRVVNLCQSKVCGDRVQGLDCGNAVADWLADCLNLSGVRLIQQSDDDKRYFKKDKQSEISLSNTAQFLVINVTSVRWLMGHVDEYAAEMECGEFVSGIVDRFRGNLIVSGGLPLTEQSWTEMTFGGIRLEAAGPCTRCQMICIDQRSGEKTTEPLRTIGRVFEGKMKFGMYFTQENLAFGPETSRLISCSNDIAIDMHRDNDSSNVVGTVVSNQR